MVVLRLGEGSWDEAAGWEGQVASPLWAPEQVTAPLWASVSSSGKRRDDHPVLQASQGSDKVQSRKGLCRTFSCAPPGGVRARTMMILI